MLDDEAKRKGYLICFQEQCEGSKPDRIILYVDPICSKAQVVALEKLIRSKLGLKHFVHILSFQRLEDDGEYDG